MFFVLNVDEDCSFVLRINTTQPFVGQKFVSYENLVSCGHISLLFFNISAVRSISTLGCRQPIVLPFQIIFDP